MSGAIPPLPQYTFMAWCLLKAQGQLCLYIYGTWRFTAVFTTARHRILSWARLIQSTSSRLISLNYNLILSSHLRLYLPSSLLPSGFPTKILYVFLNCSMRATCPPISYKLWSFSSCRVLQHPATSSLLALTSLPWSTAPAGRRAPVAYPMASLKEG
jgi:hypothetical protein